MNLALVCIMCVRVYICVQVEPFGVLFIWHMHVNSEQFCGLVVSLGVTGGRR